MNANCSSSTKEKQARGIRLVIVRLPDDVETVSSPERLENLRSAGFGTGPSWEHVDGAEFYPLGNEEVANLMQLASVESLTDEQYRKISSVIIPLGSGLYHGFSGEEVPPLDWIKRNFIGRIAVTQYWRLKQSDDGTFTEVSRSGQH